MQVSSQAWTHIFIDCAQAWNIDTSNWPVIPPFQPPLPPQPYPIPPPMAPDVGTEALNEEKAAMDADDITRDL